MLVFIALIIAGDLFGLFGLALAISTSHRYLRLRPERPLPRSGGRCLDSAGGG